MRRFTALLFLLNVGAVVAGEPGANVVRFPSISAEPLPKTDAKATASLDAKLDQPVGDLKLPSDATLRETLETVASVLDVGLVDEDKPSGCGEGARAIHHNRNAHAEVAGLLSALRTANGSWCASDMPCCVDELLQAVTYASGGTWLEYDGRGGTSADYDGIFVIRQTPETQATIAGMLHRMRQ